MTPAAPSADRSTRGPIRRAVAASLEALNAKSTVAEGLGFLRESRSIVRGLAHYRRTGITLPDAAQALVGLHCRTQGRSNELLHGLVRIARPARKLASAQGVLGDVCSERLKAIDRELRTQGFFVFPERLPEEVCAELERFALTTAGVPVPRASGGPDLVVYDPRRPAAELVKFREASLVGHPAIQRLAADASLIAVAQQYLDSAPVLDIVTMWWSTLRSSEASVEAAQLFHFDMDRIKWLKFFFYLTDVTPDRGPHCYVARSHRAGGQPRELLRRGYARIPDADIARHYPEDRVREITGPRGTIFAADTRAFHKGVPPRTGDRLLLELEWCDSLFGSPWERCPFPTDALPALRAAISRDPRMYRKYLPEASR